MRRTSPSLPAHPIAVGVAVLPFRDLARTDQQGHLCRGLAQQLIDAFACVPGLFVTSSQATARLHAGGFDPPTIGRQLSVGYVLHADLQRADRMVRITPTLLRVADGHSLWTATYDEPLDNVLTLLARIVRTVSPMMTGEPLSVEVPLVRGGTWTGAALEAMFRGRDRRRRAGPDRLRPALAALQDAVVLDPNYAQAFAELALTYAAVCLEAVRPGIEMAPLARIAAHRAVALDPLLPDAHLALGIVRASPLLDISGAEEALIASLRQNPRLSLAHAWLALLNAAVRRDRAAAEAGETALALDPESSEIHTLVGAAWFWRGDFERAQPCLQRAALLDPSAKAPLRWQARLLLCARHASEAREMAARAMDLGEPVSEDLGTFALIAGAAGWRHDAAHALLELRSRASHEYVGPLNLADAFIGLGRDAEALAQIAKAHTEGSGPLLSLVGPEYHACHASAPFRAILRGMGLPGLPPA